MAVISKIPQNALRSWFLGYDAEGGKCMKHREGEREREREREKEKEREWVRSQTRSWARRFGYRKLSIVRSRVCRFVPESSPCLFFLLVGLSIEVWEEIEEYDYVADEEEGQGLRKLAVVGQKAEQICQHDAELDLYRRHCESLFLFWRAVSCVKGVSGMGT